MKTRNLFLLLALSFALVLFSVTAVTAAISTPSSDLPSLSVESNMSLAGNFSLPQFVDSTCYEEVLNGCLIEYASLFPYHPGRLLNFCRRMANRECNS
jgi:hypothetical protein